MCCGTQKMNKIKLDISNILKVDLNIFFWNGGDWWKCRAKLRWEIEDTILPIVNLVNWQVKNELC